MSFSNTLLLQQNFDLNILNPILPINAANPKFFIHPSQQSSNAPAYSVHAVALPANYPPD